MVRLRKILLVTAIAVPLSLIHCAEANADGDPLLLFQQVLQFAQDFDLDEAKWKDYAEKFKQLEEMAETIADGSKAYSAIKSMGKTVNLIKRCGDDAENYYNYLKKYSTGFRAERADLIIKGFNRRTATLCKDISSTIGNITGYSQKGGENQSTSVSPLEILRATDEVLEEFAGVINDECEELKATLANLCLQESLDETCRENQEFVSMGWY